MDRQVVILQEYVPQYRLPFFKRLGELGQMNGISIIIGAGTPSSMLDGRDDGVSSDLVHPISQKEYRLFGRRLVFRDTHRLTAKADLIIIEQARRNLDSYRVLFSRRGKSLRAMWGHGKDYVSPSSTIGSTLMRLLTNRHSWFFGYTQSGVDAAVADGFPRSRTTNVQNSIDSSGLSLQLQSVSAGEIRDFRFTHSIGERSALFIGGLDDSKRLDFLIEAAKLVHEMDATFKLVIAGNGLDRHIVETAAAELSFIQYVGSVFGREKALLLKSCSVIAMPGRVGLVSVDSFVAGCPVVTTDWPWHAPEFDYLVDGVNSLVTPNNLESYAEGLFLLLNDTKRLGGMKERALESADRYSVEGMAQNFMSGILGALDLHSGSGKRL